MEIQRFTKKGMQNLHERVSDSPKVEGQRSLGIIVGWNNWVGANSCQHPCLNHCRDDGELQCCIYIV
eukprot:5120594-Amphidinium_carterae.2